MLQALLLAAPIMSARQTKLELNDPQKRGQQDAQRQEQSLSRVHDAANVHRPRQRKQELLAVPVTPTKQDPPSRQRVAVVSGDYIKVSVPDNGESLRKYVVERLQADMLLLLMRHADNDGDVAAARARYAPLEPLSHFELRLEPTVGELATILQKHPDFEKVFKAFSGEGKPCARHKPKKASLSPFICSMRMMKEFGNYFTAPVLGNPTSNVLKQLYTQWQALLMVGKYEEAAGRPYEIVIWTRLELQWIAPHPPLSLLSATADVWVPYYEDYAGLNDRHALMRRSSARVYFGRWDVISNATRLLTEHPSIGNGTLGAMSAERFMATQLAFHNVSVGRFPPTAYLSCCNASRMCFHNQLCAPARLHPESQPKKWLNGKYRKEIMGAVIHASGLENPRARFIVVANVKKANKSRTSWSSHLTKPATVQVELPFNDYICHTMTWARRTHHQFKGDWLLAQAPGDPQTPKKPVCTGIADNWPPVKGTWLRAAPPSTSLPARAPAPAPVASPPAPAPARSSATLAHQPATRATMPRPAHVVFRELAAPARASWQLGSCDAEYVMQPSVLSASDVTNATARAIAFLRGCNVSTSHSWRNYMNASWWRAPSDQPCTNPTRLGPSGEGGKMVCDPAPLLRDRSSCLVVSVGLNGDTSFEEALHSYAPHCTVHGYDGTLTGPVRSALAAKLPKWLHFHPSNFGSKTWQKFAEVESARFAREHVVDVLKIDCETCEHSALAPWLDNVCTEQVLLEFHGGANPTYPCGPMFSKPATRTARMHKLFTRLHEEFDIFAFEDNLKRKSYCGEYALKRRSPCPRVQL